MQSAMWNELSQEPWAAARNCGGICHTADASIFGDAGRFDCGCDCDDNVPTMPTSRQAIRRRNKRGLCIFFIASRDPIFLIADPVSSYRERSYGKGRFRDASL